MTSYKVGFSNMTENDIRTNGFYMQIFNWKWKKNTRIFKSGCGLRLIRRK